MSRSSTSGILRSCTWELTAPYKSGLVILEICTRQIGTHGGRLRNKTLVKKKV